MRICKDALAYFAEFMQARSDLVMGERNLDRDLERRFSNHFFNLVLQLADADAAIGADEDRMREPGPHGLREGFPFFVEQVDLVKDHYRRLASGLEIVQCLFDD